MCQVILRNKNNQGEVGVSRWIDQVVDDINCVQREGQAEWHAAVDAVNELAVAYPDLTWVGKNPELMSVEQARETHKSVNDLHERLVEEKTGSAIIRTVINSIETLPIKIKKTDSSAIDIFEFTSTRNRTPTSLAAKSSSLMRLVNEQTSKRTQAKLTLSAYALLGLAARIDFKNYSLNFGAGGTCRWCHRKVTHGSVYCVEHRTLRGVKLLENREVIRNRARVATAEYKKILRSDRIKMLRAKLMGLEPRGKFWEKTHDSVNPLEGPLWPFFYEYMIVTPDAKKTLLNLHAKLPHVSKVLDKESEEDFMHLVKKKRWHEVLNRLRRLDEDCRSADLGYWVRHMIEAEAWLEVEEAEKKRRLDAKQKNVGRPPSAPFFFDKALKIAGRVKSKKEIAAKLGVSQSTLSSWMARYPDFRLRLDKALRQGKSRK